jgi:uncharacterized protein YprB with RNaseH-like and TPR domain
MKLADRVRRALQTGEPELRSASSEHEHRLAALRRELARLERRTARESPRLPPSAPRPRPPAAPSRRPLEGSRGMLYRKLFPEGHRFGRSAALRGPGPAPFAAIRRLCELEAGFPASAPLAPGELRFLDIESTGLSRSAGTLAFLVGVGRFLESGFEVSQVLLTDPAQESTALAELVRLLDGGRLLVSFNGRGFDLPVLRSRALLARTPVPLEGPHLDLLPAARRLFRGRLLSCRLSAIEQGVFGFEREGDISGAEVPQIYGDYLRSGRTDELERVLEHNLLDVAVLAVLLEAAALHLCDPLEWAEDAEELEAAGRFHLRHGARELGEACLRRGLELARLPGTRRRLLARLAEELRRAGRRAEAAELWELHRREFPEHRQGWLELAKYHEHVTGELARALSLAEAAPHPDPELPRRLARLRARLARSLAGRSELNR